MNVQTKTSAILAVGVVLFLCAGLASLGHAKKHAAATPAPAATPAAPAAIAQPAPAPALDDAFADASRLGNSDLVRIEPALSHPTLLKGDGQEVYFEAVVSAHAKPVATGRREPVQLALVIDCSGSMEGEKINDSKVAAREVVKQLGEGDRFVLVSYDTYAHLLLPSTEVSAESRERALQAIDELRADGTTNLSGGVQTASRALLADTAADHSVRRLVLLSDGQANVGETRNEALFSIAGELRNKGIGLSTLGVGADFNAQLMEGLAENGGGRFRFLENPAEIAVAFTKELQIAARLVAADVRVVLHPAEGTTIEDVYGNLFDRVGRDVVVHLPDLASTTQLRVLARLRVNATADSVPVIDTLATFADVSSDRARVSSRGPQLAVRTTTSPAEVSRLANREVLAFAINGKGIADARRAIELYDQGRQQEALASLDSATNVVQKANVDLKSSQLSGSIPIFTNLRALFGASANALGGDEASVNVRLNQRKAIRNFGSNNIASE